MREAIVFGTLTGLTGLPRIDFGIILLGFLICLTLHQRVTVRIGWGLLVLFTAFFIVLPWFIWVYYVTGQVMPSSGLAETNLINLADLLVRFRTVLREIISLLTLNLTNEVGPRILVAFAFFLIFIIFLFSKEQLLSLTTNFGLQEETIHILLGSCPRAFTFDLSCIFPFNLVL